MCLVLTGQSGANKKPGTNKRYCTDSPYDSNLLSLGVSRGLSPGVHTTCELWSFACCVSNYNCSCSCVYLVSTLHPGLQRSLNLCDGRALAGVRGQGA